MSTASASHRQVINPHPLYLAEVQLGRMGRVFIETDRDSNSRDYVISLIASGEIDPVKVLEIDEGVGSVRDVTDEIVAEAMDMREAA